MALDERFARLTSSPISAVNSSSAFIGILYRHREDGAALRVHRRLPELLGVHLAEALVALDVDPAVLRPLEVVILVLVAVDPDVALLPLLDAVERRLGDIEVAAVDDVLHVAVEERQQQRADMRAVDIGIGHDDDAVVAQLREIEDLRRRRRPAP